MTWTNPATAITAAVSAEAVLRAAADATLTTNLAAEVAARIAAIDTVAAAATHADDSRASRDVVKSGDAHAIAAPRTPARGSRFPRA